MARPVHLSKDDSVHPGQFLESSGDSVHRSIVTILAVAPTPETDYITATIDLESLREFRLNSRVFHQRRPELYAPLARTWEPWRAYEKGEESEDQTNGRP
jgi:hypothetical protein